MAVLLKTPYRLEVGSIYSRSAVRAAEGSGASATRSAKSKPCTQDKDLKQKQLTDS